MSVMYCDMCDRRVDTDEDQDGVYDCEQDVYFCPLCVEESDVQYLVQPPVRT